MAVIEPAGGWASECSASASAVRQLAEPQHLVQRDAVAVYPAETLGSGPAPDRGEVRQQIRRRGDPASGRVDEVQPDRVAQQGEFRLRHEWLALRNLDRVPAAALGPVQRVVRRGENAADRRPVMR